MKIVMFKEGNMSFKYLPIVIIIIIITVHLATLCRQPLGVSTLHTLSLAPYYLGFLMSSLACHSHTSQAVHETLVTKVWWSSEVKG